MSRICPNCLTSPIHRYSRAQTCCWPCGMEWRARLPHDRARRLDQAAGIDVPLETYTPEQQAEVKKSIASTLPKPIDDIETAMKTLFGEKPRKEPTNE